MSSTTLTAGEIAAIVRADLGEFAADLAIPVARMQAQGDLYVLVACSRHRFHTGRCLQCEKTPDATRPLPTLGETLVVGRGGNAHVLAGRVLWDANPREGAQTLGTLTVPADQVGYLFHAPEHGPRRFAEHAPNAVAPGTYVIRRQREQADQSRLVED